MLEAQKKALLQFQQQQQSLVLATLDRTKTPCGSYSPFVATDLFTYFIFVSGLAKHTENLLHHPITSVMLLEAEDAAANIFARKRFTLTCSANLIIRDEAVWPNILDQFEQRFGSVLRVLRQFADFQLIRLQAEQGLWVSGFGQAFWVKRDPFQISESLTADTEQATTR